MQGLALNKTALNREREKLDTYTRYLPALELKRDQLFAERSKAARERAATEQALNDLIAAVGSDLPMLANADLDLSGLVETTAVDVARGRLVGLDVPVFRGGRFRSRPYGLFATPHWVDELARRLEAAMTLRLRLRVESERLAILERALKKINQRINLFEKVLIPDSREIVHTTKIALEDADRAAVVRAKIAKRRRRGHGA